MGSQRWLPLLSIYALPYQIPSTLIELIEYPYPRLFALLIGINKYSPSRATADTRGQPTPHDDGLSVQEPFSNLRGAVADAEHVKTFLVSRLQVPEENITLLCDENATKENIEKGFVELASNERIVNGDTIVIFYAGHGGRAPPPKKYARKAGCPPLIEFLVPYNHRKLLPGNQESLAVIPDYTVAKYLRNICKAKGQNLTVIFDCCHSASANRGSYANNEIARGGPPLTSPLPDSMDDGLSAWLQEHTENLSSDSRGSIKAPSTTGFKRLGNGSYIFFAACATHQEAREINGRGHFTKAFMSVLEESRDLQLLSCSNTILHLPTIPGQNPQLEGNGDRPVFHNFPAKKSRKLYPVFQENPSGPIQIKVGSAVGFHVNDTFTLFKSNVEPIPDDHCLGDFTVTKALGAGCYLAAPPGATYATTLAGCYAEFKSAASAHLLLYSDPKDTELTKLVTDLHVGSIQLVERQNAYISLAWKGHKRDTICFTVVDREAVKEGFSLTFPPSGINKEDTGALRRMFEGLAHYYWHLKRAPQNVPQLDGLSIQFHKLVGEDEEDYRLEDPQSAGLQSDGGKVKLSRAKNSSEGPYGFKIINRTTKDLYPYFFSFDNSDFSISSWYQSPQGGNPESPLKSGKEMEMGYGHLGYMQYPVLFQEKPGIAADLIFVKLFVSTHPLDLGHIPQESPWLLARGLVPFKRKFPPVSWAERTMTLSFSYDKVHSAP